MTRLSIFFVLVFLCLSSGAARGLVPPEAVIGLIESCESVRACGMGGAFVSQADDGASPYSNAAGIMQIQAPHASLKVRRKQGALSLTIPAGANASLGLNYSINDQLRSFGGSLAWQVQDAGNNLLLMGAGLRTFTDPDVLEGFTFDLGLLARPASGRVAFGAALQNLGPQVQWMGDRQRLPTQWRIGTSLVASLDRLVLVNAELSRAETENLWWKTGVEVGIAQPLSLRVGYRQGFQSDPLFSVGMGVFWQGLGIDYAWEQAVDRSGQHSLQVHHTFGGWTLAPFWRLTHEQVLHHVPQTPTQITRTNPPSESLVQGSATPGVPAATDTDRPAENTASSPEIAAVPEEISLQDSVIVHMLSPPLRDVLRWELQVRDRQSQVVRHYGSMGHPPRMLTWDGLRDTGARVTGGDYSLQLAFILRTGLTLNSNTAHVRVIGPTAPSPAVVSTAQMVLPQMQIACVPMSFSPDQDQIDDTAEFSITTEYPQTLAGWSFQLSIHTPDGQVVRAFPIESVPASLSWDGTNDAMVGLPMGSYSFWLEGSHPSGRHFASPPQIVTISEREHIIERIVIAADVLFELDQTMIRDGALDSLKSAALAIRTHPEAEIRIEGHADDSGDDAANMRLSAERAARVFAYLVEQESIQAYRLSMAGYGRLRPLEEEDPQQNRRVEIIITTNQQRPAY